MPNHTIGRLLFYWAFESWHKKTLKLLKFQGFYLFSPFPTSRIWGYQFYCEGSGSHSFNAMAKKLMDCA